jgi:hypothetical protein
MRFSKVLPLLTLLYGSKTWVFGSKTDTNRMHSVEMEVLKRLNE